MHLEICQKQTKKDKLFSGTIGSICCIFLVKNNFQHFDENCMTRDETNIEDIGTKETENTRGNFFI